MGKRGTLNNVANEFQGNSLYHGEQTRSAGVYAEAMISTFYSVVQYHIFMTPFSKIGTQIKIRD